MEIGTIIRPNEVITSSILASRLVKKGMSPQQARQRMRRDAIRENGVWRSEKLVLEANERLFARRAFVGTIEFFAAIERHLQGARPGLSRCLMAATRRPVLLNYDIARLSASRLGTSSAAGVPALEREIEALTEVGFRHEEPETSLSRLVQQTSSSGASMSQTYKASAKRVAETQVSRILGDHFRRCNLISWNSLKVADSQSGVIPFNEMAFCASAFSFAQPMLAIRKGKRVRPTPVLFDVYARYCHDEDVAGFQHRLLRAQHARKLSFSFLPIIAAYDFASSAFERAKKDGMLVINLKDFFGDAGLDALAAMESILTHVDAGMIGRADARSDELIAKLKEIQNHPLVVEIKGIALEATAALIAKSIGWENVRLGVNVPFKTTTRDIDVLGMRHNDSMLVAIECKAHRKDVVVQAGEIKKFFTEAVPALVKSHSRDGKRPMVEAQFWTTGVIGDDANRAFKECRFGEHVQARLFDLPQILDLVPDTLRRSRALFQAVAAI